MTDIGQRYHNVKPDEIELMREVLRRHDAAPFEYMHLSGYAYTAVGMHPARAYNVHAKWAGKRGWWEWGMTPLGGWLEPAGPPALRAIVAWHDEQKRLSEKSAQPETDGKRPESGDVTD